MHLIISVYVYKNMWDNIAYIIIYLIKTQRVLCRVFLMKYKKKKVYCEKLTKMLLSDVVFWKFILS